MDRVRWSIATLTEVHSVSEVQVYYKDTGHIAVKVDIVLPSNLTIAQAHAIAGEFALCFECGLCILGGLKNGVTKMCLHYLTIAC